MIKDTLKTAIRSLSKKHSMQPTELRIKISKNNNDLRYEIMKNKEILEETNVALALNLNSITAFWVGNKLNSIMDNLINEYQVPKEQINVRIYTKDTERCEPMLYLFDGTSPKTSLDLNKFI